MLSKMNIEKPWKLFNQKTRQSTILRTNEYIFDEFFWGEEPANERSRSKSPSSSSNIFQDAN